MIFESLILLSVLAAGPSQSKADEFPGAAVLPDHPVVYYRSTEAQQNPLYSHRVLLSEANLSSLAQAFETLGYMDQTQPGDLKIAGWTPYGGIRLARFYAIEVLAPYTEVFCDWGRGDRPERTQKALQAIRTAELAIYPDNRAVQIMSADVPVWLSVMRERGPVSNVGKEGSFLIQQFDRAQSAWYVATSEKYIYRSKDLALLQRILARVNKASVDGRLVDSELYRSLSKKAHRKSLNSGFIDIPLFIEELRTKTKSATPSVLLQDQFFQGMQGVTFCTDSSTDSQKLHFSILSEANSIWRVMFASKPLSRDFFSGFSPSTFAGIAWHLGIDEFWVQMIEPVIPFPVDVTRFFLALGSTDQPVLIVGMKGDIRLKELLSSFASTYPSFRVSEKENEIYECSFAISVFGINKVYFAKNPNTLLAATNFEALSETVARLIKTPELLDGKRFQQSPVMIEDSFCVADISDVLRLLNYDFSFSFDLLHDNENSMLPIAKFEAGMNSKAQARIATLLSLLREKREEFVKGIEERLFEDFAPPQKWGTATVRFEKNRSFGVLCYSNRLEIDVNMLNVVGEIAAKKTISLEEARKRQFEEKSSTPLKALESQPSLAFKYDLSPLYEDFIENSENFQKVVFGPRFFNSTGWTGLRGKLSLDVYPKEDGFDILFNSDSRAGVQEAISYFLDNYRPSADELRVIQHLLALEEGQKLFTVSRRKDTDGNKVGEFGSLEDLIHEFGIEAFSSSGKFDSEKGELNEFNYQIRLLLPEGVEQKEKRWCAFAFSFSQPLAFYIDERGILFAGIFTLGAQGSANDVASEIFNNIKENFSKSSGRSMFSFYSRTQPPEHRDVYEYFMPYMAVYGKKLRSER